VKSRLHGKQGSITLRPVMDKEGNKLLINFMKAIKYDEIRLSCNAPIPIFYLDSSLTIFENQFNKAANFAFFLGLVNFWRLRPGYITEYGIKVRRVLMKNYINIFRK
jgi:hypothetical protein